MNAVSDWNKDIKPKMRQIIDMLKESPLPSAQKLDIKSSVEHLYNVRPKAMPSANPKNQVVVMDEEQIKNFSLSEWLALSKEFNSLSL